MANRIVSLIASGTEIVSALGFGDELVGRSHECDFPESVESLPVCSAPRINVHVSSLEIDQQVQAAVRDALSVYTVFVDRLDELSPTHIVTQSQCEVCAVSLNDVRDAVCRMVNSQPEIIALEPMDLNDVYSDIVRTAEMLGDRERGTRLVGTMQSRLDEIRAAAGREPTRPSIVCLEWLEPLMSAGNWVPELVEIAGGRVLLGTAGVHSPYFSWEDLLRVDPDVIAILPCGFDIPRTNEELHVVTRHPAWRELSAVRNGRVYVTDGNQYFNRPGPRIVESAEILFEILHCDTDEQRRFWKHHGSGWLRLDECA